MAGVTEVAILYLIANSIKLHCDYCIFTGNAVPLNTCFDQLYQVDPDSIYKSYKFICDGTSNGILQLDYTNPACLGMPSNSQTLYNIIEYGCSTDHNTICSADQYVLVDLLNGITSYFSEIGYIINKCVAMSSLSTPTVNISKFTQCTSTSLIEWVFTDNACTSFKEINQYHIGDSYQFDNVIIENINYCPSCTQTMSNYIVTNQPNIEVNYIVTNDATYTFPEPMGVCNQFIYDGNMEFIASYEYSCDDGDVYKKIWKFDNNCTGLYDENVLLIKSIDYLDANCDNYVNMLSKTEFIQPSTVKVSRYENVNHNTAFVTCSGNLTTDWSQVSYITNYCVEQNDGLSVILEAQDEFLTIHHYSDNKCQTELSECMILWKSNDCNLMNQLYYEVIEKYTGIMRNANYSLPTVPTIKTTQNELSIDIPHTETNYIDINYYREPIDICNEYVEHGVKHSYKFVCINGKIKKRKWKNKHRCNDDDINDIYDEEEDMDDGRHDVINWSCGHSSNPSIKLCKVNCFKNSNYWEQKSVILNNCIQINDQRNSIYIECYWGFTMTYYYFS